MAKSECLRKSEIRNSKSEITCVPSSACSLPLLPLQMPVEKPIRHLARFGREVMLAVGVVGLQIVGLAVKSVNRHGRGDRLADAGDFEVAVPHGAARQEGTRGEC